MSGTTDGRMRGMRRELARSIAEALPQWFCADNIILDRQTDVWNDLAAAIAASSHGIALHVGVAEGTATEEDGLEMEITVPLTLVATHQTPPGAAPEEEIWEALTAHVHDLRLCPAETYAQRFRFRSFSDVEMAADRGTPWLGRQTVFLKRLSL